MVGSLEVAANHAAYQHAPPGRGNLIRYGGHLDLMPDEMPMAAPVGATSGGRKWFRKLSDVLGGGWSQLEPRAHVKRVFLLAAYGWASPNTLLGLLAGLVVLALGGRVRVVRGVAEFSGGLLASWVARTAGFCAITFGHVILGVGEAELAAVRSHEHVHVRQYEAWGPFFLFAYAGSSLWQLLRGRRMHRDNFFERQAYAADARSSLK